MEQQLQFYLRLILKILILVENVCFICGSIEEGGLITTDTIVQRSESPPDRPMLVKRDVHVAKEATLTFEAGVEIHFSPGVMLSVNGTLKAKGTETQPIVLSHDGPKTNITWDRTARLVDDRSVMEGRLQLFYKNRWRGVCTNGVNWTAVDANVTCRQLGFNGGLFRFEFFARNDSDYAQLMKPQCRGHESSIVDCPGALKLMKIGTKVCSNQKTVTLKCEGLRKGVAARYWWGLEFYNSTYDRVRHHDYIQINESSSILEHVYILYAGVDPKRQPVPAIRASPRIPVMNNVQIWHSALDATNFTDIKASAIIHKTLIANSRGHGLVVETYFGRVNVTDSNITSNQGQGVKVKYLDGRWPVIDEQKTFCRQMIPRSPLYPIILTAIPIYDDFVYSCHRDFHAPTGKILTLSFLEMDIEPSTWATVEVYDQCIPQTEQLIAVYHIVNQTLPQGITSRRNCMRVLFKYQRHASKPRCPTLFDCIKITMIVDAGHRAVEEFYMNNSLIQRNLHQGIYLENVRNYIFLNHSQVIDNEYSAGLRVFGGAADIHINGSSFARNQQNGINITYDGGMRIFNHSSFSHNYGHGINITFNATAVDNRTRIARHQRTEVFRSTFLENQGVGVRVGNFCQSGSAVINESHFIRNKGDAIVFESCWLSIARANATNFTVGYSEFDANYGHAIASKPFVNVHGAIRFNNFNNQLRHVILLDNTNDFLWKRLFLNASVDYSVDHNRMKNNSGFYVAHFRLTEGSNHQRLVFRLNALTQNKIRGAFPQLNQRTRAHAVLIISSSNVKINRNSLVNKESKYELATQILDRSVTIDASAQWWGEDGYEFVVSRLFDQMVRYNLASLHYNPVLKDIDDPTDFDQLRGAALTLRGIYRPPFQRSTTICGQLNRTLNLGPGNFSVDCDISILKNGHFRLRPGTTLFFANALGMLVQGRVELDGTVENPIVLDSLPMASPQVFVSSSDSFNDDDTDASVVAGNATSSSTRNKLNSTATLIRLTGGSDETEGLLEVRPSEYDEWGTVCNKGWNILAASIACQQLALVVHPAMWQPKQLMPSQPLNAPIWRSHISCGEMDLDIMSCPADGPNDHSCTHDDDILLRCIRPSWAGIHLEAQALPSSLTHVKVTRAGLMDPSAISYVPSILVDYNRHRLEHFNVTDGSSTGLMIMKNHVYSNARIQYCTISQNIGSGLVTRSPFLLVEYCNVVGNWQSGVEFDPHLTTSEAEQIRAGILRDYVLNGSTAGQIYVGEQESTAFLVTEPKADWRADLFFELTVDDGYRVTVDIIDYNPDVEQEEVRIYDSRNEIDSMTQFWMLEEDMVEFPVVSSSNIATLRWHVKKGSTGRLALAISSKRESREWPFPDFRVRNSTIEQNGVGIVTRHYNQPSNERLDLFHRYRWQQIEIHGILMKGNQKSGLHAPSITKYDERALPSFEELQRVHRIAEITYAIDSCIITENGGGAIIAEHNHVEFSNNVWIWQITHNLVTANQNGGFFIELPKVHLDHQEVFNHSVDINDTVFTNNARFEFRVDGFYCNSSIARNRFAGNDCRMGCIMFGGTEKDIEIVENEIVENTGRYMIEMDIHSHTPYTRWVDAVISDNNIAGNQDSTKTSSRSFTANGTPRSFAVAVYGVQNVTINNNLFNNPNMQYELVAGQSSSMLENFLDIRYNYWGSTDQSVIQSRIFDFDDWNNFAQAEYYPFLIHNNLASPATTDPKLLHDVELNQELGGRIEGHLTIQRRKEPYLVTSDLTVMEKGSLKIESGVTLEFAPNIGLLILGEMNVIGFPKEPIIFRPMKADTRSRRAIAAYSLRHGFPRKKRSAPARLERVAANQVRLTGPPDGVDYEGFLQIYNSTEQRWTFVCDKLMNVRTAEVACKTMGKPSENVVIRTSRYYDHFVLGYPLMHEQRLEWFWRDSFVCDGREENLDDCRYRFNYDLLHCMERRDYVYVRCGPRNLADEYAYWGNIRLSTAQMETTHHGEVRSVLQNVHIFGAGILHGEKVAAIQAVHRSPTAEHVRITHSASHGYDLIAPSQEFLIRHNTILNNQGYGVGAVVLGESRVTHQTPFRPLKESQIPYNLHGLVRMCTSEKVLYVQQRLLLYYKYNFETVDCLKIIRSHQHSRRLSLRFLQFNLLDDPYFENAVTLYDGEYLTKELRIASISANSSVEQQSLLFETGEEFDTMGIRVTASAAYGSHGFLAEIMTAETTSGSNPGDKQSVQHSEFVGNEGGGVSLQSTGEHNPSLSLEQNRLKDNGLKIFNLTAPATINIEVQNTPLLTISNNHIEGNAGAGLRVRSFTRSGIYTYPSNITNNVFLDNSNGPLLHISGDKYQGFSIRDNVMNYNDVQEHDLIFIDGVQLNFTQNMIMYNRARTIINSSSIYTVQKYYVNWIIENRAVSANKTTIFLYDAHHSFQKNFFLNTENAYDMVVFNRTRYVQNPDDSQVYPEVLATNNWWGSGAKAFVAGRIWDRKDDDNLLQVNYEPYLKTNKSLLDGKCEVGWNLYNDRKCFFYIGGALSYSDAKLMCSNLSARIAGTPDRYVKRYLASMLLVSQLNHDDLWPSWVQHDWRHQDQCSALVGVDVHEQPCHRLMSTFCEMDPYAIVSITWWRIYVPLAVAGSVLFFVVILGIFACLKSRHRMKQRLDRRSQLRSSVRASKASLYSSGRNISGSAGQLSRLGSARGSTLKKRRPNMHRSNEHMLDISGATLDDTKTDTTYHPSHSNDSPIDTSQYLDSDMAVRKQQLQFRNKGYDDRTSPLDDQDGRPTRPPLGDSVPRDSYHSFNSQIKSQQDDDDLPPTYFERVPSRRELDRDLHYLLGQSAVPLQPVGDFSNISHNRSTAPVVCYAGSRDRLCSEQPVYDHRYQRGDGDLEVRGSRDALDYIPRKNYTPQPILDSSEYPPPGYERAHYNNDQFDVAYPMRDVHPAKSMFPGYSRDEDYT